MRRICQLAIASLALFILFTFVRAPLASAGTHWGANYFPNVPLVTQDGKTVHLYDDLLKGRTVLVSVFYTQCQDSCPLETARLLQVQHLLGDRVGKDVFFYSISIDPEHDTPAVLKAYADKFHVGPGWTFLTGTKADVDLVAHKLGLYYDPGLNRDGHTVDLMIGNEPTGQWLRNAATDNARFLANNITTLIDGWNSHKTEAPKNYAQATPLNVADRGQYLFATRCAACHTIGHGVKIGPDLANVTHSRDRLWLLHFIQKPDELLAEKDPLATSLFKQYKEIRMPNTRLGPDDTLSIVRFLEGQSGKTSQSSSTLKAEGEEKQVEKSATQN
ncbi:MAG TPA: SCO family protein [Candidatus Angelobacter sp.]|nr:SCO family protein [Candidatus Angelobacter sp.]